MNKTIIILAFAALGATSAHAFSLGDIQVFAGTGSQTSAIVIQWETGATSQALVWGFRHNGTGTVETALRGLARHSAGASLVDGADSRLFMYTGEVGAFGLPLYGLGYDGDGSGVTGAGYSLGASIDEATANDPNDLWKVGWAVNGFWSLHQTTAGSTPGSWSSAQTGVSGANLSANSWHALVFAPAPNWSAEVSSTLSAAPVPEPGLLGLLGLGALAARRRFKKA